MPCMHCTLFIHCIQCVHSTCCRDCSQCRDCGHCTQRITLYVSILRDITSIVYIVYIGYSVQDAYIVCIVHSVFTAYIASFTKQLQNRSQSAKVRKTDSKSCCIFWPHPKSQQLTMMLQFGISQTSEICILEQNAGRKPFSDIHFGPKFGQNHVLG